MSGIIIYKNSVCNWHVIIWKLVPEIKTFLSESLERIFHKMFSLVSLGLQGPFEPKHFHAKILHMGETKYSCPKCYTECCS